MALNTTLHALLVNGAEKNCTDFHLTRDKAIYRKSRAVVPIDNAMLQAALNNQWESLVATTDEFLHDVAARPVERSSSFRSDEIDRPSQPKYGVRKKGLISDPKYRVRVERHNSLGHPVYRFRFLQQKIIEWSEIGLPAGLTQALSKINHGMILFSGPQGAGKSTTMFSLLQETLNNRPVHVCTIESPVEQDLSDGLGLVSRLEVGPFADFPDYHTAVRDILRHDTDVFALGEMFEEKAMTEMLIASNLGMLTMGTLHGDSISGTLSRFCADIKQMTRADTLALLSRSLRAVVNLRHNRVKDSSEIYVSAAIIEKDSSLAKAIKNDNFSEIDEMAKSSDNKTIFRSDGWEKVSG